jgi:hypothetical protein
VAAPPLTEAEYAGQVNPICKDGSREGRRMIRALRPSGDPGFDAYRVGLVLAKSLGRTTRRIAAVKPPATLKDEVGAWIRGLRDQKRLTDKALRLARQGKIAQWDAVGRKVARLEDKNGRRASQLGLPACSR